MKLTFKRLDIKFQQQWAKRETSSPPQLNSQAYSRAIVSHMTNTALEVEKITEQKESSTNDSVMKEQKEFQ